VRDYRAQVLATPKNQPIEVQHHCSLNREATFSVACTSANSTFDNCIITPYTIVKDSTEVTIYWRKNTDAILFFPLAFVGLPLGMGLMM